MTEDTSFYDVRMSKITDNLYVSEYILRENVEYLKSHGITTIIDFTVPSETPEFSDYPEDSELTYIRMPMAEHEDLNAKPELAEKFLGIMERAKGGVLLICVSGNNKSPAMAMLWLIHRGMIFEDAFKLVESTRGRHIMMVYRTEMAISHMFTSYLMKVSGTKPNMPERTLFTQDYYDEQYFSDKGGKLFVFPNGMAKTWGYKNPEGDLLGGEKVIGAWKTMFKPKNLLDVGAGRGALIAYARDVGIEGEGFDFSEYAVNNPFKRCKKEWLVLHDGAKPWPYPDGKFDLVDAIDFYEHIYEDDLKLAISEAQRVSNRWLFLQIATVKPEKEKGYILKKGDKIPFEDGRTWAGHVTVMDEGYWIDKFENDNWFLRRDLKEWFESMITIRNWTLNSTLVFERLE